MCLMNVRYFGERTCTDPHKRIAILQPPSSYSTRAYQFLPLDELPHRVALDVLREKVLDLDGLPEEGQAGLVSQDVLDLDPLFALLAELWPVPSFNRYSSTNT